LALSKKLNDVEAGRAEPTGRDHEQVN